MATKFTPINGTYGAAAVQTQARSQGTVRINGIKKAKRNSATDPDKERMKKCRRDLIAEERTEGPEWWPEGIPSTNAVVTSINTHGVPDALAHENHHRDSDTHDFVFCAKATGWTHGQIGACIGRTEQASRLILHRAKKRREEGLVFMREIIRYQPGDPEPVPPAPVAAQAVEDAEPADHVSDTRALDVLAQAAAASAAEGADAAVTADAALSARQEEYQPCLKVMGII